MKQTQKIWNIIGQWSMNACAVTARQAMILYFIMTDPATPLKVQRSLYNTLSKYFTSDPDTTSYVAAMPGISAAYEQSAGYVTPEMEQRADSLLGRLTSYSKSFLL